MEIKRQKLAEYVVVTVFVIVILAIIVKALIDDSKYHYPPELTTIGNLRTVFGSQNAFTHFEGGYAGTWKELRDDRIAAGKPAYLDIDLSKVVGGYKYTLKPAGNSLIGKNGTTLHTDFVCVAEPFIYETDRDRSFYVDSSGIIRFEVGKIATKDSQPI